MTLLPIPQILGPSNKKYTVYNLTYQATKVKTMIILQKVSCPHSMTYISHVVSKLIISRYFSTMFL